MRRNHPAPWNLRVTAVDGKGVAKFEQLEIAYARRVCSDATELISIALNTVAEAGPAGVLRA